MSKSEGAIVRVSKSFKVKLDLLKREFQIKTFNQITDEIAKQMDPERAEFLFGLKKQEPRRRRRG